MYTFLVLVHLAGVFGFLLAHGVSAGVAIRLRRERDIEHVKALLDLSSATMPLFYVSLLLLLGGGIAAAFVDHLWDQGWIWAALGVLLALMFAMYGMASPYYGKLREAVGQRAYGRKKGDPAAATPPPPASPEVIDRLLSSPRPIAIAAMGAAALLVILWLMVLKPF